ncbi:MAG: hypothetical protein NWP95_01205, partial [Pontimonas sp.]|nr:hypothetical protein [Pontimonas sp.]
KLSMLDPVIPKPGVGSKRQRSNGSARFDVTDEEIAEHTGFLVGKARSDPTRASYVKLWNSVVLPHCRWRELDPFALSSENLVNLLSWHEMQGKAGEVERLFNAIRVVYASRDLSLPVSPLAREVVKGANRIHAEEKADVSREGFPVHAYVNLCSMPHAFSSKRAAVRDLSVLGLGLRAMRRPSELVKLLRKHLKWVVPSTAEWECPEGCPEGFKDRWLSVYIRDQKNDKEARGQWILIEPTWTVSCPCSKLVEYCKEFEIQLGDSEQGGLPLFMSLQAKHKGLTYPALNSLVKRAAGLAGLGAKVTGHSLRIGGATAAAAAGLGLDIIRTIGGWFGDAVFRYIRAAAAPALAVTAKMGF